ncbi:MAG TPA: glutathione S-transferase family protein [Steroidobacteraceae bacterium]|jgi:glutathione S-transferase|nr:glutathione S-transferase family protein [Steroidobacteraceae bacterium]HXA92713.1 glutathione S-transferase family protein [Steroidobacteraceae bacterium]
MLKLFYTPGACSLVPHIVLEEAGAPYDTALIDFARGDQLKPEFLELNPKARVPVLVTEHGTLTEIPAILGYIVTSFPDARLADLEDRYAFAAMQAFQMYIATSIHVTFRQISRPDYYADGAAAAAALRAKVPERANEQFALIERQLADGRPWVHGERYTASDPYLFVFASYLKLGDRGDPGRLPAVMAHRSRVRARPAVERVLRHEGLAGTW